MIWIDVLHTPIFNVGNKRRQILQVKNEYYLIILFCLREEAMKSKSLEEFEKLYSKFKTREMEIPESQRWKLLYIAERIYKTQLKPMELTLHQQQEIKQLLGLDTNTLAIVFNFLIKTLLVQRKSEIIQCKIKYPGMFELWKNCRLGTAGKNLIVINQKILHKYELALLDISNCKKSKNSFDLYFKNQFLFSTKFNSSQTFKEFIAYMEGQLELAKESQTSRMPVIIREVNNPPPQVQKSYVEINTNEESVDMIQKIEKVPEMQKKSSQIIDEKPPGYQIIQENQNLLICLKSGEPRLYISLLMTTQCQLDRVVNFYIQQKEWNGFINLEQIKQEGENQFEVYRTFKKQSIIQTEKSVLAKLRVICSKNSANLIEESVEDDPEGKNEKIQCTMKAITKFYRCLGGTKIIIDTSLRTKGYNNLKYSINMLIKLYSDLKFFQNGFKISQLQKNKLKNIISPVMTSIVELRQSRRKQSSQHPSKNSEEECEGSPKKGENDGENANTNDTLELNPIKDEKQENKCLFLKLKPCSPLMKPGNEYIEMVESNEHERCYLSFRFNQSIQNKYDNYTPPYCLSEMMKKGTEYRISKDNQLIYINYDVLNGQKDSLKFIIKQIGANIITGKSCLNVSMPVDIFESRSLLQRSACAFGSVPDYLLPVADADPLTQIKNVLTLFATIPTLELLMQKPFNPILGETFQAYLKGIPIYYEQISHHPPISAFYMTCPEFTMHGKLVAFADVSLNSAVGGNEGVTHIIFRNGSHFQCYFPPCEISGLIFGNRSFRAYGKGYILEKKSNLFAEMSIQKAKKGLYEQGEEKLTPADLIGGIFRVKPEFMSEISSQGSLRKFSGLSKKQVQAKVADIRGIWFQDIKINGEVINKNIKVYPLEYPKVALPSDSNYREDILYHKINDLPQSQKMKEFLEVKQRSDRKLREKYAKLMKKKSS